MNRKNILFVILFFVLLVVFFGTSLYLGFNMKEKELKNIDDDTIQKNEVVHSDDTNKVIKVRKNENYTFYKERESAIVYGFNYENDTREEIDLLFYFYVDKEKLNCKDISECNNEEKYVVRMDIFVKEKLLVDSLIVDVKDNTKFDDDSWIESLWTKYSSFNYFSFNDNVTDEKYYLLQFNGYSSIDDALKLETANSFIYLINTDGDYIYDIKPKNSCFSDAKVFVTQDMIGDKFFESYYKSVSDFKNPNNLDGQYFLYPKRIIDVHDDYFYYLDIDNEKNAVEYKVYLKECRLIKKKNGGYPTDRLVFNNTCN